MRSLIILFLLVTIFSCNSMNGQQKVQMSHEEIHAKNIANIEKIFGHPIHEYTAPFNPLDIDTDAGLQAAKRTIFNAVDNGFKVPNECMRRKISNGSSDVAFTPDQIWTAGQLSATAWDETYDVYTSVPGKPPVRSTLRYQRKILFPRDHPFNSVVMSVLLIHEMLHQCQMESVPDMELKQGLKRYMDSEEVYMSTELPAWQLQNDFFQYLINHRAFVNCIFIRDDFIALPQIISHYQQGKLHTLEQELRLTYRARNFK